MRNTRFPGLAALALGAAVLAGPAAAQQQPARPAPAPAPAVSPDEALGLPPADWWFQEQAGGGRFPGTAAARAYRELLAGKQPRQPVVVAIVDTGVDIEHEDLDGVVWTNEDEVPGNGVDDDRNGYVDDVHGWNFIGGKGGNVHQDTYEITRVYASLRRYEGARQDTLSAAARAEYQRWQQVKTDFQKEIASTREQLQQVAGIKAALDQFLGVLRREVGSDSLTVEKVTALRPVRMEVMQAQQAYLQLAAAGITPRAVDEEVERLQGRLRNGLNPDFNPRTVVGDDPANPTQRGYGNNDVEGPDASHGTHVAGIVGAERGNGIGVDGIAPAVRIMPLRVVPDGDERDKDVANAIRYAVDNGAKVINMSFGKAYSPQKGVVDEAVRYADSKGVLLVHAAGNDARNVDTRPSYPVRPYQAGGQPKLWIEVGASSYTADSLAASFSNYSRTRVDVFAPGVSILSTVPGNGYERNQGTSMSAPVVSGLAALIMSYYPQLTAEQVRAVILDSATRFPDQRVVRPGEESGQVAFSELSATGGVVNAYEALRLAAQRAGSR